MRDQCMTSPANAHCTILPRIRKPSARTFFRADRQEGPDEGVALAKIRQNRAIRCQGIGASPGSFGGRPGAVEAVGPLKIVPGGARQVAVAVVAAAVSA